MSWWLDIEPSVLLKLDTCTKAIRLEVTRGIKTSLTFFLVVAVDIRRRYWLFGIITQVDFKMPRKRDPEAWWSTFCSMVKFGDDSTVPVAAFISLSNKTAFVARSQDYHCPRTLSMHAGTYHNSRERMLTSSLYRAISVQTCSFSYVKEWSSELSSKLCNELINTLSGYNCDSFVALALCIMEYATLPTLTLFRGIAVSVKWNPVHWTWGAYLYSLLSKIA